ncbi:CaiB/BaiF CoA transferase family protein [Diaphorobacter aerolatus]|uniref:CoA transferase n=1 Tax=Diaphorobacter aerolatus TaxID=1288495 RepID=A0A7H0GJR9_9BURK|nr:CaiB/BaiF CoA-transferase family protein [Diaphorobacter aerolatus]QNP48535.1 CoA transferase [Diaphorobacter aerolatus]
MTGPLNGLKVVEMQGVGPGPFCAMVLADMGAEVLRICREGTPDDPHDVLARGRLVLPLNLRSEQGRDRALAFIEQADILIEGFRPGVMERLGLGPDTCLERNPALVYGRMTGWGQTGPLSHAAGHDINYISISGALHAVGPAHQKPSIPLNYVGDFGGGAMLLAVGVLGALHEARRTGRGQVIDAAMSDGAALMSAMMYGFKTAGSWSNERGENLLDGGAHFYDTYVCADGKHLAVGPIEPQFYAELRRLMGLADEPDFDHQNDRRWWPKLKVRLADLFRTRTREQWCLLLEGTDACVTPVLDWDEAPAHPHNVARGTFKTDAGLLQPAPAPRFSAHANTLPGRPRPADETTLLTRWRSQ